MERAKVKLIGKDGNVFNIIGLVSKALKSNKQKKESDEFTVKAFECKNYDEVLTRVQEYVEVE